MKASELILASGSPRRRELLDQANLNFRVIKSESQEKTGQREPSGMVMELSGQKAAEVSRRAGKDDLVLGADTLVSLDGRVLGKPADEGEAFEMIRSLAGRAHEVYTGVTLMQGGGVLFSFSSCTRVHLYPMEDEEIKSYIATGEPMDKAGSYGIQGAFAIYVRQIEGDYNNVVGFPLSAFYQECKKRGIYLPRKL